jgi:hypothetical protein
MQQKLFFLERGEAETLDTRRAQSRAKLIGVRILGEASCR